MRIVQIMVVMDDYKTAGLSSYFMMDWYTSGGHFLVFGSFKRIRYMDKVVDCVACKSLKILLSGKNYI